MLRRKDGLQPLGRLGSDLDRPESVLPLRDGTFLVSDRSGVARKIGFGEAGSPFGRPPKGVDFLPNGLALLESRLLVANASPEGGIWSLERAEEEARPFLLEADGIPLAHANYVLPDGEGGTWITISAAKGRPNAAYNSPEAGGALVHAAGGGARVALDGLRFANECRLGPDGRIYVAETASARVSRMRVLGRGGVGPRETFCQFPEHVFPEGLLFDPEGRLWVASVISNSVWLAFPDGSVEEALSDADEGHVRESLEARARGDLSRDHFYRGEGEILSAPSSLAWAGASPRKLVLGSLTAKSLPVFELKPGF